MAIGCFLATDSGGRRSHANVYTTGQGIFNVIVRGVLQYQLFFESLAVAASIVPHLPVLITGLEGSVDPLFLRPGVPCRLVIVDRQSETMSTNVIILEVFNDHRLSGSYLGS